MPESPAQRVAVYTGAFDPVHLGHLDIIRRGSRIFDRLVVGVGVNPEKTSFLPVEERVDLLERVVAKWPNVEVRPFTGLAVRFVHDLGAAIILRGLRTLSDMDHEFTMSLMNLSLDPTVETVFLLAKEGFSHISSTLIRQIAGFEGELGKFVPPEVMAALKGRLPPPGSGLPERE